jgi:hypothetical protein
MAKISAGHRDHTTSPSARNVIRLLTCRVHRIPCPTFVTIAKRPSVLGRDGKDEEVIWVKSEPKYFFKRGWTGMPLICPSGRKTSALRHVMYRKARHARA